MQSGARYLLILGAVLLSGQVCAQIYTCVAPDGTRIFSDEKCGPDAKVVKGITSRKRSAATPAPASQPKTPAELEQLLKSCNSGDEKACMSWTKGGGPAELREKEKELASGCDAGSLEDCEQRYCRDGASDECRRRVLQVASMSGETWYLRERRQIPEGSAAYFIRCMREGSRETRDATITCAATAGPERCNVAEIKRNFPRLDLAASTYCSAK